MYQHTPCSTSVLNWSTTDSTLQLLMTGHMTPDWGMCHERCVGRVFSKNAAANVVISKDRATAAELRIRVEYFKLVDNVTRCGSSL
jgi:hypothetical protein